MDSCQGVKQGDTRVKVDDLNVNCLLYADDAVLIAWSECELQALVTTLEEECNYNGLSLDASKTMAIQFEKNEEKTECKISVNGNILEQMNEVVYLGSMFSRNGKHEMDAEMRIAALMR